VLDPAGLLGALKRLRYARSSGRAEALFRVAFAAVLLIQLLWLRENVAFFYSTESPRPPAGGIAAYYTPGVVWACYYLWLGSAVLLLLGLFTRAAAVSCFLGCFYFLVFRQPAATHAADWLIPGMAFHVALLPSNRYFALERRWLSRPARNDVPAWPLRLAQLSLAFFYFTAGTSKLGDPVWWHGKGFFMTFANPVLSHVNLTWLATLPFVSPAINYLTILWECAMPLLLLWRRTRLFAVLSAVAFLLAIDLDLPVGWFSWFCIANLFAFADDLTWPPALVARFPWLVRRSEVSVDAAVPARRGWRDHAVTAFLAFHLLSFAWMQLAYVLFAKGRYEVGMRLAMAPVLGTYGYGIANVRFFALWPSVVFYPLHLVYLEVTPQGGAPTALPPFDDNGRARIGWLTSREVRKDVMLMSGLSDEGWRGYFEHVGQGYAHDSGKCPEQIQAYAITVGPGSFDTDLRSRKGLLKSARFECSPVALQVRLLLGSKIETPTFDVPTVR
jgi:hypothetical protein